MSAIEPGYGVDLLTLLTMIDGTRRDREEFTQQFEGLYQRLSHGQAIQSLSDSERLALLCAIVIPIEAVLVGILRAGHRLDRPPYTALIPRLVTEQRKLDALDCDVVRRLFTHFSAEARPVQPSSVPTTLSPAVVPATLPNTPASSSPFVTPSPSPSPYTRPQAPPQTLPSSALTKLQELQAHVLPFDLEVVDVLDDGNCLFRALSHCVYRNESHHQEFRLATAAEILRNGSRYHVSLATQRTAEAHAVHLSHDDNRTGDCDLQAWVNAHKATVFVHHKNWHQPRPFSDCHLPSSSNAQPSVYHLGLVTLNHFVALISLRDEAVSPAPEISRAIQGRSHPQSHSPLSTRPSTFIASQTVTASLLSEGHPHPSSSHSVAQLHWTDGTPRGIVGCDKPMKMEEEGEGEGSDGVGREMGGGAGSES